MNGWPWQPPSRRPKAPLESGSEGKSSQFVLLCRVLCGQMHYTDQMSDGTATATAKQVDEYHNIDAVKLWFNTILHIWKVPGLWADWNQDIVCVQI